MILSELVHLKNQLEALSTAPAREFVNLELGKITHLVDDIELAEDLNNINVAVNQFDNTVTRLRNTLQLAIEQAEKPWFQESYRLHEEEIWQHPPEHIFKVCMPELSTELNNIIKSRLNLYSSWYHAGMLIRPGTSALINQLVSFDPLYVLDQSSELLAPSVEQFPEQYQHRLRQYIIEDVINTQFLDKLPNGQFSLCVAYMYFNYKPLEVIRKYFNEIFEKLKPGGSFAFTFNDCDRASAVKLVELHFCCYTPGFLIEQLAQSVGFEITYKWYDHGPVTWLELRRPGTLTSIKGGQSLGKIVPK
jgi:hypothetical protein